jgi:hypothetical protein
MLAGAVIMHKIMPAEYFMLVGAVIKPKIMPAEYSLKL